MGDTDRRRTASAQLVVLEGPLKKRSGGIAVMHDRYCVATWEDAPSLSPSSSSKAVVVRTYKTRAAYVEAPQKPLDVHTLKCVSAWDGKGKFHTYPFGFVMETSERKLVLCAAPSRADQDKWMELLTTVTTPRGATAVTAVSDGGNSSTHTSSGQHAQRVGTHQSSTTKSGLFGSDDEEEEDDDDDDRDFGKAAAAAVKHARQYEQEVMPHAENDLLSDDDDHDDDHDGYGYDDDGYDSDENYRRRVAPVSPLALSPPDDKLLFRADSSESLTSSHEERLDDHNEPDDWGIYGDAHGHGPSRYDVVDGPVLSLDTELLNDAPKAAAPLASDAFLFEQNGPTFGAVVVPASSGGDDDFVDPVLQERMERKKKEKQLKRVTKKLESNRDLYAEMAAARLKSMRKDAKTKPRPSVVHRRRGDDDDDDDDDEDDWSDGETVDEERFRAVSAAESSKTSKSSTPKTSTPKAATPEAVSAPFELEEIESEDEPFIQHQSLEETAKKKKKSKKREEPPMEMEAEEAVDAAPGGLFGEDDLLFGDASAPVETAPEPTRDVVVVEEKDVEDEEEARRRRREKRRLKRQQQEEEAARAEVVQRRERQTSVTSGPLPDEPVRRSSMDDQWQRATESQKRKDERRRARKEKARQEAEAAAAAEELARQHREEMRRLEEEEAKQERRERRERKKSKEKSVLEKKAKELKKREAELLAEAEKLKQTQEALLKSDEIKDVARKSKRRDKYTSPTDRIQRREKEVVAAAQAASEMSTALVVVEAPSEPAPPAVSTATMTEPSTVPVATTTVGSMTPPPQSTPVVAATTPAVPVPAPIVAEPFVAPPASIPAAQPMYTAASDSFVPPAPQSMPTMQSPMGLQYPAQYPAGYPTTATPFPMAMPYGAPYPGVHYTPGFAPVPYGPGMAMPTPYYPHLGYVGGIAPMSAPAQMQAAFAMMQPPSSTAASMAVAEQDEPFIGPQLPSPKSFSIDHPPAPTTSHKAPSSIGSLPDLPDVAAF